MEMIKKFFRKIFPVSKRQPIIIAKMRFASPDKKLINYLEDTQGRKKFLIIGVPEHSNVGDHAIAEAEKNFLADYFPSIESVEISIASVFSSIRQLAKYKDDCIICCLGGGNLGTLYWFAEKMIQLVLEYFNSCPVIIFPQTVCWEPDSPHYKMLPKVIELYERHPDLTIFIRDKSVDFMEKSMNIKKKFKVLNVPDIVLYLNKSLKKFERKGILLCLRSDKEKIIRENDLSQILSYFNSRKQEVFLTDMVYSANIPLLCRSWILKNKFEEFSRAKLVVTDRLHGMIFCAVTGTPCVALNNSSAKVQGVYDLWLKDLPYIKFANTIKDIETIYEHIDLEQIYFYDSKMFKRHWDIIAQILASAIK